MIATFFERERVSPSTAAPPGSTLPWYAIRTKDRCEALTVDALQRRGYECFLPTGRRPGRRTERVDDTGVPLFPGYVFCRLDPQRLLAVLATPGVIQIAGGGNTPLPVEQAEISAIQAVLDAGLPIEPCAYYVDTGAAAERGGSPDGSSSEKQDKLILSVRLLQRSVAVGIDEDQPCAQPAA